MNINAGIDVEISNGDLFLPKDVFERYSAIGIKSIFPWQADCLSIPGVLGSLILCNPLYFLQTELEIWFILLPQVQVKPLLPS